MKNRMCEHEPIAKITVRVCGPSSRFRGLVASSSEVFEGDVLVFSGSPAALECVRLAFAAVPGRFAAGVVSALSAALAPPASSGWLPGV